jgi:AraC-like DNA-binding protein
LPLDLFDDPGARVPLRSFQRRLAECGADFSRLVLDARISLSEHWLRETDRPITDIARGLGNADSANFPRAFRRVNGLSPNAYRVGPGGTRAGVEPLLS